MSDLKQRIASLPREKQSLLVQRMMKTDPAGDQEQRLPRRDTPGPCPLSFAQQRLWFLNQMQPDSPAYNISRAIQMSGALNVEALRKALSGIVARHEVLRTTYATVDGSLVQVIGKNRSVELPLIDFSDLSPTEREAEVQRLIVDHARRTFNLSQDLMLRATLFRLSKEEHVLLWGTHHIAFDGWSNAILLREIAALYEAFAAGGEPSLQPLPIQFADFAQWQRQWLRGDVLESRLSYWKQQLGDYSSVLELPTDQPRPAIQTYQGASQSLVIPESLTEALKALSRKEEVTLFMTLLAAFQTLLHRYTGQNDIAVGSPVAGRNRAETENLIGCFINTLVLRNDFSGNPTFRELLHRVRESALEAYTHQDLPFEKLVEELHPARDLSRNPLFQVMFVLQNTPRSVLKLPHLTLSPMEVESGTAQLDLSLSVTDDQNGLVGTWRYNTDLFDSSTISRMMGHFQTLLKGGVANPDARLSDLPLLTEAQRHQLLVEWNDTHADYPKDSCIHQLFEAQVERTPDQVALDFEGEQVTYRDLNSRANRLGHHLRQLGVGPETIVAVCLHRSIEMLVALLGVLKAGAAYLPLDPEYPTERLSFMLEDTELRLVVTQERLLKSLSDHAASAICIDRDWDMICRQSDENPISGVTPENLAYVIYTSGSTGRPKGTLTEHRAISNQISWMQSKWAMGAGDRIVQKTPFSFDVSMWELFWPVMVGARLVIALPEGHKDPTYLRELVIGEGITVIHFVPSMLQVFLEQPDIESCVTLRVVLCGGEALPPSLQRKFFQRLPGVSLVNLYGPTEASISVTGWTCDPQDQRDFVPIGYPASNIQLYILDGALQPVPIGVRGELHIGGLGLARGYLKRPDLMAERFIPNVFSDEPTARLYKTGDMARYLPDGSIEFLGRMDDQVKVRGFRIELGEIEAVLAGHPEVREAVVMTREDAPGGPGLMAYLICDQESVPSRRELRTFLKERLPDYMIPDAFVSLDTLPLTPNGKVDRRALPPPVWARPELEKGYVAPRTPVEEVLASIWSDVLGLERVGIHDNFFDSGGHSLLGTQVIARVLATLRIELPLRSLFEEPTVAEMALVLIQNQAKNIEQKGLENMLAELEELSTE